MDSLVMRYTAITSDQQKFLLDLSPPDQSYDSELLETLKNIANEAYRLHGLRDNLSVLNSNQSLDFLAIGYANHEIVGFILGRIVVFQPSAKSSPQLHAERERVYTFKSHGRAGIAQNMIHSVLAEEKNAGASHTAVWVSIHATKPWQEAAKKYGRTLVAHDSEKDPTTGNSYHGTHLVWH